MMMNHGHTQVAEALVFVHGPRAEAEAARQAIVCEKTGDTESAENWRRIEESLRTLRHMRAA